MLLSGSSPIYPRTRRLHGGLTASCPSGWSVGGSRAMSMTGDSSAIVGDVSSTNAIVVVAVQCRALL